MSGLFKVTPEMNEAWCAYEPVHAISEGMRFAQINGLIRHAFLCGYAAAMPLAADAQTPAEDQLND